MSILDLDRILAVLDKAHEGPVFDERTFNMDVVAKTIQAKVKEYDLAGTCDVDNPVLGDDELVDRFYRAGFDAAVEIGLMCTDTHRAIQFSAEEMQAAIDAAPSEFWLGRGDQRVHYQHRDFDDPTLPVWTAPLSIAATEDVFLSLVEGFARVPEIDAIQGPSLETIWGRPLRSGSPYEHLAGRYQADLMHEGISRAGREGMPIEAIGSSTTHIGLLGGYGVKGGYSPEYDAVTLLSIADFWTSYEALYKLTQTYVAGGGYISASTWVMLGGYAGGPEGTAVACIAYSLLVFATFQAARGGVPPFDLSYMGNTGRRAQWTLAVTNQAMTRNTNVVLHSIVNQVAGPGTKTLLYETIVGMTNMAVCGVTNVVGTRSAGGRLTNYLTPLEHKFGGEVFKAAAGMSREQGNDIANLFIPKYEDDLIPPPDGRSFQELYDVDKLEPIAEWQQMYDEVKQEAIDAGLPMG
jgi:methylamine--corrinoid protein Co-methyltransferase